MSVAVLPPEANVASHHGGRSYQAPPLFIFAITWVSKAFAILYWEQSRGDQSWLDARC